MNEAAADKRLNVLFLCTGNSARSIIAEAILSGEGRRNFRAFSAGSHPKGHVHPYALDLLRKMNFDVTRFRSKSWSEFRVPTRRSSILRSRFATTRPRKPVRFGPVSR